MKRLYIALLGMALAFAGFSCGGGGGGGDSSAQPQPQSAEGTWNGSVTFTSGSTTKSVGYVGLVSKTGETFFMVADPNYTSLEITAKEDGKGGQVYQEIIRADSFRPYKEFILREKQALERLSDLSSVFLYTSGFTINGDQFSSYVYSYNYLCQMNGGYNTSGTVKTKSSISGIYSDPTLGSGSFSFSYDPLYDRGSSLSLMVGDWEISTAYGALFTHVYSDGTFSGVITPDDVTFSGRFSIIDQDHNCYGINFQVSGVGEFNGLAVLVDIAQSGANDGYLAIGRSSDGKMVFPLSGIRKE